MKEREREKDELRITLGFHQAPPPHALVWGKSADSVSKYIVIPPLSCILTLGGSRREPALLDK